MSGEIMHSTDYAEDLEWNRAIGLLPKKWEGCSYASYAVILTAIETKTAQYFVWPGEGRFDDHGRFQFNKDHKGFEPLLIDIVSAQMIIKVHDAVSDENKVKLRDRLIKSRGHFGGIMEIVWKTFK